MANTLKAQLCSPTRDLWHVMARDSSALSLMGHSGRRRGYGKLKSKTKPQMESIHHSAIIS